MRNVHSSTKASIPERPGNRPQIPPKSETVSLGKRGARGHAKLGHVLRVPSRTLRKQKGTVMVLTDATKHKRRLYGPTAAYRTISDEGP